jgi:hypothetical protein
LRSPLMHLISVNRSVSVLLNALETAFGEITLRFPQADFRPA